MLQQQTTNNKQRDFFIDKYQNFIKTVRFIFIDSFIAYRYAINSLVLFTFILVITPSCKKDKKVVDSHLNEVILNENQQSVYNPINALPNDNRAILMINTSRYLTNKILESGHSIDSMWADALNGSYSKFISSTGLSADSFTFYNTLIKNLATELIEDYQIDINNCTSCLDPDISKNKAFAALKVLKNNPNYYNEINDAITNGGGCNIGGYLACCAMCAFVAGPAVPFGCVCIYGCFCQFCFGGNHDKICAVFSSVSTTGPSIPL